MPLTCSDIGKLVHPYLDGEFSDEDRVGLEQHANDCAACRDLVQYEMAFKAGMRAKLTPPKAPSALRAKVMGSLDELDRVSADNARGLRWAWLLPATAMTAAAAAITLFFLVPSGARSTVSPGVAAVSLASEDRNPFIPEHYVRPIAVNAGNRSQLQRDLSRQIGVSVRLPRFGEVEGTPVSARITTVRGRRAVQASYSIRNGSDDLSVYVFDPTGVRVRASHRRRVGDTEVMCDSAKGVRSLYFTKNGVGYALTSGTLSEDQLLQLVGELGR